MSIISDKPYPFAPFIRQLAVDQKASTSSALSEKVQSVSEKNLGKSEAPSSQNQDFVFDELQDQYKIHLLTFFDLPELAEFSLTSTTANALASDFQIWNSIAKRINCPIDKASDRPIFKQVLDFIDRIREEAVAIENRPGDITLSLKGPTIDQINTIQKWLQARKVLINWHRLAKRLNHIFPRLNFEGPGAIKDLTTQETIAKARLYPGWYGQNHTLLKARDIFIVWRRLAASANLPGPNLSELNTEEDIITKSREFDAWFNANQNELIQSTILDLSDDKLTSLPEQIGQLSQLEKLDLCNNRLTSVPEWIGRLSKLENLDLSFNQLTAIPQQIGQLSKLKELNLMYNQLTSLPQQIGQLSQLEKLDLNNNKFTALPEQIGQLSQLEWLYLNSNQFTSIPEQIVQLSQLVFLGLKNNQLTSIPPQLGRLSKLRELNLSYNQLNSIPLELSQLSQLRWLHLSYNQLNSLPEQLGQLSQLKKIDLSYNQLNSLPEWILQFSWRIKCLVDGNPLSL